MERYIGLDPHGTSCTFGVIGPSGRKLRSDVVETNGGALVSYLNLPALGALPLDAPLVFDPDIHPLVFHLQLDAINKPRFLEAQQSVVQLRIFHRRFLRR